MWLEGGSSGRWEERREGRWVGVGGQIVQGLVGSKQKRDVN